MDLSTIVRPTSNHLASDLGDEVVLMSLKSGTYFGLKNVGLVVWAAMKEEPRSVGDLADRIVAEYAVPRERAEADLLRLLGKMEKNDLIEVVE